MRSTVKPAEVLDDELAKADVVDPFEVSFDVVTMNSIVTFEDIVSGYKRTVRLVYPEHADSSWDRVSILSPLGSALLGLRVGTLKPQQLDELVAYLLTLR
jgi:regulator of nucleoside diphosphate kinase